MDCSRRAKFRSLGKLVVAAFVATILIAGAALAFAPQPAPMPAAERIPATLVKIAIGQQVRLESKDQRRLLKIQDHKPEVMGVTALSATEFAIDAKQTGFTEMLVTYENQHVEHFVVIVTDKRAN